MMAGQVLWNRRLPMRDGTDLAADVLLPAGEGPWPAVVLRTPYMRTRTLREPKSWPRLVDHGYAFVAVDVRGRGDSDGEWTPWVGDGEDGHDTVEWAAAQPWCNGRVGMVGASYEALTQWWAARERPPHLECIAPLAVGVAYTEARGGPPTVAPPSQYWLWWLNVVSGRTLQHPGAPSWEAHWDHLPARELAEQVGAARHWWPRYVDREIQHLGPEYAFAEEDWKRLQTPALVGLGWWDDQATVDTWLALQGAPAAASSRLLIGAWDHQGNEEPQPELGGIDVSASAIDTVAYVERFLAAHLKPGEGDAAPLPRCSVFRTGAMEWDELERWPAARAEPVAWHLGPEGSLDREPAGREGAVEYLYDPADPARELSSLSEFAWSDPPFDERYLLRRDDFASFASPPLTEPLAVSGAARFEGFVSIDRPSADLFVRLYDVHPDGRWMVLGGVGDRAASVRLAVADDPAPRRVEIHVTWLHHSFEPGHRIGLGVTSGLFPVFARNLGGGEPWADAAECHPTRVTLHHGPSHPARLLLPVEEGGR